MSLRRSTRVQALSSAVPVAITSQTNGTKRKASTAKQKSQPTKKGGKTDEASKNEQAPTLITPPKNQTPRKKQKLDAVPPITPTPAAIGLMMAKTPINQNTGALNNPAAPQDTSPRPAEPHVANAPVKSPDSNKVVTAYSTFDGDDSGAAPPAPTGTTSSLLADAEAHLIRMDTTGLLAPLIEKHHCKVFDADGLAEKVDPWRALASSIIAQQVSGAAASSIKNKFIALFEASDVYKHAGPPHFPPPAWVAVTPIPRLRTAGLSQRKAEYIQGLAVFFDNGTLSAEMLAKASDEEVMEKLIAVRGLGKWSVEMFACFSLKRMDVFSTGDLGVQ